MTSGVTSRNRALGVVVTALVAAALVALALWGRPSSVGQVPRAESSAAPKSHVVAVAAQAATPVVGAVASDAAIAIGSTGAKIQLSGTGACLVADDQVLKDASSIVPTGCVGSDPSNSGVPGSGLANQLVSWNSTTVVYGLVPTAAARVSLVESGQTRDATVVQPGGQSWRVFYFVLPFKPYDVSDASSERTHYALTVSDGSGKTLLTSS